MVGHKVGTVLVRNMMHSMPGIRRVDCYDLHSGGYDWGCWPRVLAAANASNAPLIIVDPLYDWTMEGMYEALGDRMQIVVATRDPAERALSEYYYDLKAIHPHEGVVSYRKPITIDDGASFWLPNRTQQESLRLLPPVTAVLMAARMGSSDNERLTSIARRILSGPPYSTIAILADLVEGSLSDFDATWRSVCPLRLQPIPYVPVPTAYVPVRCAYKPAPFAYVVVLSAASPRLRGCLLPAMTLTCSRIALRRVPERPRCVTSTVTSLSHLAVTSTVTSLSHLYCNLTVSPHGGRLAHVFGCCGEARFFGHRAYQPWTLPAYKPWILRQVFRFLLLPESADHTEADLEACLRIAQHQNLAGMNHSATHQTNTAAVHIEREQLKKALLGREDLGSY